MPRTRKHKHHAATQHHHIQEPKPKTRRSAALMMALFIGCLALVIGAFASSLNYGWMIACAVFGALAGGLIGHGIDRSIEKK